MKNWVPTNWSADTHSIRAFADPICGAAGWVHVMRSYYAHNLYYSARTWQVEHKLKLFKNSRYKCWILLCRDIVFITLCLLWARPPSIQNLSDSFNCLLVHSTVSRRSVCLSARLPATDASSFNDCPIIVINYALVLLLQPIYDCDCGCDYILVSLPLIFLKVLFIKMIKLIIML